ncbi:MAG: LacI family DNA-binding transcriptional regulator [Actinomycetota bacterium]|nr:LacI family DNA-binding transcriptional regulator [Actinomycetota bacterium]
MTDQPTMPAARARATMKDVARRAGVSLKTVSRVVNGEPGVVEELSTRVRDAVAALNYEPNLSARSLRRLDRRSSTIAVLLEDLSNPYSAHVLRAIESTARERGVSVLAASLEENPERERQLLVAMSRHRVDGVIIAPASADHRHLLDEQRAGVPFVFVDRPPRHLRADAVVVDGRCGTRAAVDHLIAHGHRRIAFLGDLRRISTAAERLLGFCDALEAAGLPVDPALVVTELRSVEAAREATGHLLDRGDPPTAFFAGQNFLTMGVVYALRAHGASHRVALVGFDDFDLADVLDPPVTVVAQDLDAIGRCAADLLFSRIDGDSGDVRTASPPWRLVARGSGEIAGPVQA